MSNPKLPLTRQAAKLLLRNVPMLWRGKRTRTGICIFAYKDKKREKEARSFLKRLYKFETENPPLSFASGAINWRPFDKIFPPIMISTPSGPPNKFAEIGKNSTYTSLRLLPRADSSDPNEEDGPHADGDPEPTGEHGVPWSNK
jgi:hypothetical protein